jgi:hypothetical protein
MKYAHVFYDSGVRRSFADFFPQHRAGAIILRFALNNVPPTLTP